jgi:hypothetical protein
MFAFVVVNVTPWSASLRPQARMTMFGRGVSSGRHVRRQERRRDARGGVVGVDVVRLHQLAARLDAEQEVPGCGQLGLGLTDDHV